MSIENLAATEPPKAKIHPDLTKTTAPPTNEKWTPHDKIVLIAGKFDEIEEEEKKLKGRKKRLKQQAMNQGITMGTFQRMRKDLLLDPDTVIEREAEYRHYMLAFDSPVGTQLSLFPAEVSRRALSQKEQMDKAFGRGRTLGILGKDPDEQAYPTHTDLGQEHRRGWTEGQKVNLDAWIDMQEEGDREDAEEARKKEAKLAEQKKKTEAAAAEKRDKAAAKLAEKERKKAEKKAAKEEAATKKKAAAAAKAKDKPAPKRGRKEVN